MSGELGPASTPETASTHEGERIAKRIARSGYCSRRDAERLIAEGRVAVDGTAIESPEMMRLRGGKFEDSGGVPGA